MGHCCRICGRERPHEQFSGKGHRIHVCKRCRAKPKIERRAIEDQDDIACLLGNAEIVHNRPLARATSLQKSFCLCSLVPSTLVEGFHQRVTTGIADSLH